MLGRRSAARRETSSPTHTSRRGAATAGRRRLCRRRRRKRPRIASPRSPTPSRGDLSRGDPARAAAAAHRRRAGGRLQPIPPQRERRLLARDRERPARTAAGRRAGAASNSRTCPRSRAPRATSATSSSRPTTASNRRRARRRRGKPLRSRRPDACAWSGFSPTARVPSAGRDGRRRDRSGRGTRARARTRDIAGWVARRLRGGADGGAPDPAAERHDGALRPHRRRPRRSRSPRRARARGRENARRGAGSATLSPRKFWSASADGSLVYFTSKAALTKESYTGVEPTSGSEPRENPGNDLYRYDVDTQRADRSDGGRRKRSRRSKRRERPGRGRSVGRRLVRLLRRRGQAGRTGGESDDREAQPLRLARNRPQARAPSGSSPRSARRPTAKKKNRTKKKTSKRCGSGRDSTIAATSPTGPAVRSRHRPMSRPTDVTWPSCRPSR